MKVIGIQKDVTFTIDGNDFEGLNLYVSDVKPGVEGVISYKFFINKAKPIYEDALKVKLGDDISFTYNRFGKPEMLYINAK